MTQSHNQFDHQGYTRHGSWQSHNQLDHLGYTRHGSWHSLTISLTTRVIQDMGHDSLTISLTTRVIQDMGHDSLTISLTTRVIQDMGHDSLTISWTTWVIRDMGHGRVSQSVWPTGLYKTWVMTQSHNQLDHLGYKRHGSWHSLTISLTTWVIQDMGHDRVSQSVWPPGLYKSMGHGRVSQSVWSPGLYKTWVMTQSHNQFDHLGYTRHGSWHSLTISLTTWVIQDMGHDSLIS